MTEPTVNIPYFLTASISFYTLYFIITVIGKYYDGINKAERSALLINKSEILFKRAMINFLLEPEYNLKTAPIAKDEPQFAAEIANASNDLDSYIADRDSICQTGETILPDGSGIFGDKKEQFIIWPQPPQSKLYDFWAGLDGFAIAAAVTGSANFTAPNQNIYPTRQIKITVLNDRNGLPRICDAEIIAREMEYAELALEEE